MQVGKCGAATEYTTLTISDVNATMDLFGPDGKLYRFLNQIVAPGGTTDAAAGDSGAIFYTTKKCKKGKGH